MKHDEFILQCDIVKALREKGWVVFSVPNERNSGIADSRRMKSAGLTKGAPDLVCWRTAWPESVCFWLELKTPTGKRSKEQECFEDLAWTLGIHYRLVRSLYDIEDMLI